MFFIIYKKEDAARGVGTTSSKKDNCFCKENNCL